jgi:hypothetical protein
MFRNLNSLAKRLASQKMRTQSVSRFAPSSSRTASSNSRFASSNSRYRFAMEENQGVQLHELSPAMQQKAYEMFPLDDDDYEWANEFIKEYAQRLIEEKFPALNVDAQFGLEWDYYRGEFSVHIDRIDFTDLLKTPRFAKYKSLGRFLKEIITDFDDSSTTVSTGFHGGYKLKGNQDYGAETTQYLLHRIQDSIGQFYGSDPKKGYAGLKQLVEGFVSEVEDYLTDYLSEIVVYIKTTYEEIESFDYFKQQARDWGWGFDPMTGKLIYIP